MPLKAQCYINVVIGIGFSVLTLSIFNWHSTTLIHFLLLLTLTVWASGMKMRFPGMSMTVSLSFPFILIAIVEFSLSEATLLGAVAGFVQCVTKAKYRPDLTRILFNICAIPICVVLAYQ